MKARPRLPELFVGVGVAVEVSEDVVLVELDVFVVNVEVLFVFVAVFFGAVVVVFGEVVVLAAVVFVAEVVVVFFFGAGAPSTRLKAAKKTKRVAKCIVNECMETAKKMTGRNTHRTSVGSEQIESNQGRG